MSYNNPPKIAPGSIPPPPTGAMMNPYVAYGGMMPPIGMMGAPPMMHMPMPGMPIPPPPMNIPPPSTASVRPPLVPPPSSITSTTSAGNTDALKLNNEKPPSTTVFVGNISERVPDLMMKQMLQRCGTVISWKRAQGANGKLQAFGFCEYDSPEATLRCIRLLNDYEIAEKKLVVKVDEKTKSILIEYRTKKRKELEITKMQHGAVTKKPTITQQQLMKFNLTKRKIEDVNDKTDQQQQQQQQQQQSNQQTHQQTTPDLPISLESVDEDTLKEDRLILNAFDNILRNYSKELNPQPVVATTSTTVTTTTTTTTTTNTTASLPTTAAAAASITPSTSTSASNTPSQQQQQQQQQEENGMDSPKEKDNNTSVSAGVYMKAHLRLEEIKLDADKKEIITSEIQQFREKHRDEGVKMKKEEKERIERVMEREKERKQRERDREQKRSKSRERERDRRRERSGSRGGGGVSSGVASSSKLSSSRRSRSPRSKSPRFSRTNSSSSLTANTSTMTAEEIEELNERKRLERKLREKEAAYRERLREWEAREEKRAHIYEIERQNEIRRRKEKAKLAKEMKKFMEDYDDDKDDAKYYEGSSMMKKLKMREKEIEMDNRDRQRERDEIEELKKKLLNNKEQIDIENEIKKIQDDENLKMKLKFENQIKSSSPSSESSSPSSNEAESNHASENSESESDDDEKRRRLHRRERKDRDGCHDRRRESRHKESDAYNKASKNEKKIEHDKTPQIDMDMDNDNSLSPSNKLVTDTKTLSIDSYNGASNNTNGSSKVDVNLANEVLSPSLLSDETSQEAQQQQQQQTDQPMDQTTQSDSQSPQSHSASQSPYLSDNYNYSLNPSLSSSSLASSLPTNASGTVTIKKQMLKTKQPSSIKPINQAFADEDDDEASSAQQTKRLRLSAIQLEESQRKQKQQQQQNNNMNHEERKKAVKKLVESIPADREELFNYNIDWEQLDASLMDKRIKPWVNRKIIEYIGEEEATLNEFICSKIMQQVKPDKILEDIKVILDDEAELFVKKMWRLIVYETESKRLGLSK